MAVLVSYLFISNLNKIFIVSKYYSVNCIKIFAEQTYDVNALFKGMRAEVDQPKLQPPWVFFKILMFKSQD